MACEGKSHASGQSGAHVWTRGSVFGSIMSNVSAWNSMGAQPEFVRVSASPVEDLFPHHSRRFADLAIVWSRRTRKIGPVEKMCTMYLHSLCLACFVTSVDSSTVEEIPSAT